MSFASRGVRFESIKRLLRREGSSLEAIAEGGRPVATPPRGAASTWTGDPDRETSTNAQMEGAANEPWSGNR
jgi:hypothetical protein